jgi:hypothetical protein
LGSWQIATIRPLRSKLTEMQSPVKSVELMTGLRPSGPAYAYASVCQESLWVAPWPLAAMNGLRGVLAMPVIGLAVAGAPTYGAGPAGPAGLGAAAAEPAATAPSATAMAREVRSGIGRVCEHPGGPARQRARRRTDAHTTA